MLSWGDLPQLRSHGPHDAIHIFKTDPIEDLLYLEKQGGGVRLSVGEWGDNCSTVMFLSNQELSDARDIVSSHEAQSRDFSDTPCRTNRIAIPHRVLYGDRSAY